MNWAHLEQYWPEWDAAYVVSDGHYVGIGIWMSDSFAYVFLDDEDMSDHNYVIDEEKFVYWATLNVERFGVNKDDPQSFKMLNAEDLLRSKMRIIEQHGPDMLNDTDE
ncbi:MAG: hypothetical protein CMJ25_11005 [Phycisphaerae bacterium]|nr:hypothetical protein [Phycisphaerae bacterium]|tara:strand:+ start:175 stop:498 length:324 start_codon:yes stop_codon:yes gene_type:complete